MSKSRSENESCFFCLSYPEITFGMGGGIHGQTTRQTHIAVWQHQSLQQQGATPDKFSWTWCVQGNKFPHWAFLLVNRGSWFAQKDGGVGSYPDLTKFNFRAWAGSSRNRTFLWTVSLSTCYFPSQICILSSSQFKIVFLWLKQNWFWPYLLHSALPLSRLFGFQLFFTVYVHGISAVQGCDELSWEILFTLLWNLGRPFQATDLLPAFLGGKFFKIYLIFFLFPKPEKVTCESTFGHTNINFRLDL